VDVDLATVTESDTIRQFVKHVVPNAEPKEFLRKQNLIRNGKPTVAAVLLFADEPQAALPKRAGVKLYRYKTTGAATRETLAGHPKSIEGCANDLIKESVRQTKEMVEGIQKLGPKGLEEVKYPDETMHEIVANAVLHRDYSIVADVLIRVFDNRVEIESPGLLPGHVTVKNIRNQQFARNGAIVRLINKFPDPPNKDVGEGLNTAFKAMQRLRLQPPVIKETDNNTFLVDIRHEPLASPAEMVMDYLANHDEITNRVARELTGITSENSMKVVFLRLAKSGLIQRIEGRKGASAGWEKKPKAASGSEATGGA